MQEISVDDLTAAIKYGCRLDGPEFATSDRPPYWSKTRPSWLKSFQPPIQRASFEGSTDPKAQASGENIGSKEFEKKARSAWKLGSEKFERRIYTNGWPRLKRSVLFEALAKAASEVSTGLPKGANPLDLLRMRTGLQLYGVEIISDVENNNEPLDLVNGDFPFSLRLICCVVRVPLALSNLKLVTLDLSGSALVGVDAAFLRARGSVRLRHSYSSAPVDFAGAEIHGYFDGCDMLVQPFGELPASQAADGDRGMLNLSQASIDNEVRLKRAIIWGGLAMRGLKAKRTIVLDEARLLSPLAVLEQILSYGINKYSYKPKHALEKQYCPKPSKNKMYKSSYDRRQSIGCIEKITRLNLEKYYHDREISCLNVILSENLRTRTCALRAEGLNAESILARDILCSGRFRMKYAVVRDGLSLYGSSFASPEYQRAKFDHCGDAPDPSPVADICKYRKETYDAIVRETDQGGVNVAYGADDYALDLRESNFGGSVRIGMSPSELYIHKEPQTQIDGVVALERANIGGELLFDGTKFDWTFRFNFNWKNPEVPQGARRYLKYGFDRSSNDCVRDDDCRADKRYAVRARGIVVGDNVSFANSTGLRGADLSNAEIGGDLKFLKSMERAESDNLSKLKVTGAATLGCGRITLEGATIAGDCKVIFDPVEGPHLKAERVEIAGALVISAPPKSDHFTMDEGAYESLLKESVETLNKFREKAAEGSEAFRTYEDETIRPIPMIDLGNARAGFIHHPPPAWPKAGRLLITGFRYQRGLAYGPLAPHPFTDDKVIFNKKARWWANFVTILLTLPCFISAYYAFYTWEWTGYHMGLFETRAMFFLLSAALIFRIITTYPRPRLAGVQPMAIAWLNLQTVARNAYRQQSRVGSFFENLVYNKLWAKSEVKPKGNTYHSLEPYSTAAQALRDEGRWISANIVEERRLRVRQVQLSWRNNFVEKVISKSIASFNDYGFNLSRPVFAMLFLIVCGAMLSYHANINGNIDEKIYRIGKLSMEIENRVDERICEREPNGACRRFVPILFAIDKIVPTISLGQSDDWQLKKGASPFASDLELFTFESLFSLLQVAGLAITGLLLLGLTSRLGLVFNRYNE